METVGGVEHSNTGIRNGALFRLKVWGVSDGWPFMGTTILVKSVSSQLWLGPSAGGYNYMYSTCRYGLYILYFFSCL